MIDIRGGIVALTICLVIALVKDAPKPVKAVQVPYCFVAPLNTHMPCAGLKYRLNI